MREVEESSKEREGKGARDSLYGAFLKNSSLLDGTLDASTVLTLKADVCWEIIAKPCMFQMYG